MRIGDMIEHRRLQIDARKWHLSKLLPKKYGERLALNGKLTLHGFEETVAAVKRKIDGNQEERA